MPLLEQYVIVKTVSEKIFVRYECEGETFTFILNKAGALQLAGMLESAAWFKGEYEVGISI